MIEQSCQIMAMDSKSAPIPPCISSPFAVHSLDLILAMYYVFFPFHIVRTEDELARPAHLRDSVVAESDDACFGLVIPLAALCRGRHNMPTRVIESSDPAHLY